MFKLINDKTGLEVSIGDKAVTFRGEAVTITGFEPPRHSGSTGKVYVTYDEDGRRGGYYPSVIDCSYKVVGE